MNLFGKPKPQQMTITPKFKINDLIAHKFAKPEPLIPKEFVGARGNVKFFEVLYISTETCSAGTQVFYKCRPFWPVCDYDYGKKEAKVLDMGYNMSLNNNAQDLVCFREDEVVVLSEELRKAYL